MSNPKVLFYDIETQPNISYVWGHYEQNVISHHREWEMLTFSYKWLGTNTIHAEKRSSTEVDGDRNLIKSLHRLFKEADYTVAHNGDQFDKKKVAARMIKLGFPPPSLLKSIDTKKEAKRVFGFNSNKLDDLCQHLGLGRKIKVPGFELWQKCMEGDEAAFRKMIKYNKRDVLLLERLYHKLAPWMKNHPNFSALYEDGKGCPSCGDSKVFEKGYAVAGVTKRRKWNCGECGHWFSRALSWEPG